MRRKQFKKLKSILEERARRREQATPGKPYDTIWLIVDALLDPELENDFEPVYGWWNERTPLKPLGVFLLSCNVNRKGIAKIYVELDFDGIKCATPDEFRRRGFIEAKGSDKIKGIQALFDLMERVAGNKKMRLLHEIQYAEVQSMEEYVQKPERIKQLHRDHDVRMQRLRERLRLPDDA